FSFYDPAVSSKARSPLLYFKLDGAAGECEYGFAIGGGCDGYVQRLRKALRDAPDSVSDHLAAAPGGATVTRQTRDHGRNWDVAAAGGPARHGRRAARAAPDRARRAARYEQDVRRAAVRLLLRPRAARAAAGRRPHALHARELGVRRLL